MFVALILFSLYISFVDVRHHRISNRVLLITFLSLLALSVITETGVHPLTGFSVLLFTPLILLARIGAGDIKLLTVLALFFIPLTWDMASDFLLSFTLISATLLIIRVAKSQSFSGSIALAPAICGAVIWCAR
jgi:Flp pilus assembly protein protease CpaA